MNRERQRAERRRHVIGNALLTIVATSFSFACGSIFYALHLANAEKRADIRERFFHRRGLSHVYQADGLSGDGRN